MGDEQNLNRLEHNLLTSQMDDIEPLFVLYAEARRYIEEATLDLVLEALIKLVDMGFSECIIERGGSLKPYEALTLNDLKQRFEGQTEEEKLEYPMHTHEYYFKITEKGRLEEAKDIYDAYYPQKNSS